MTTGAIEMTLDAQVDRLAKFIMKNVLGEPSQSQGAIDTAIRILSLHYPPPPKSAADATDQALALKVDCPLCGAKAGQLCEALRTGAPQNRQHYERLNAISGSPLPEKKQP